MAQKSKAFICARKWIGKPKMSDFQLSELNIEPLNDGEFLAEAMFFGIHSGMRTYSFLLSIGTVIMGDQIAKLVKLKLKLSSNNI